MTSEADLLRRAMKSRTDKLAIAAEQSNIQEKAAEKRREKEEQLLAVATRFILWADEVGIEPDHITDHTPPKRVWRIKSGPLESWSWDDGADSGTGRDALSVSVQGTGPTAEYKHHSVTSNPYSGGGGHRNSLGVLAVDDIYEAVVERSISNGIDPESFISKT